MNASRNKLERLGIGLVLTLALLTFIFPLVTLRGPAGDLPGDGYHARGSMAQLQSMLTVVSTYQTPDEPTVAVADSQVRVGPGSQLLEIPFSVQVSWLTPWLIYLAVACAGLALLDLVTLRRAAGKLSLTGGCLSALAVVHVVLMGSDLQLWSTQLLKSGFLNSGDGVIMSTRLLVVNSFQIGLGLGLVGLTGCLLLVSFISSTSAVSRIKAVMRREPRFVVSQPVRVRPLHPNYPEEICTSVNLSRSGLLLESASDYYYVGMEVYVGRDPRAGEQTDREEHGSVVRVHSMEGGKCRFAISIFSHPERDAATGLAARQRQKSRHPVEIAENSL
jgi:hypothetical protein